MSYKKSPLRYPGGKSRAIKFLKDYFPKDFMEYREPFFGGGSVGLYLLQSFQDIFALSNEVKFYANDINYDLYCFWQILKTQGLELIAEIQKIKNKYANGRTLYESLLARRDEDLNDFQRAVDFFVLNRISFSGTVDSGGYSQKAFESRFTQSSIERLSDISKIIQNIEFSCENYENLLLKEGENVFIFLDPPYYSATKSRLYGKRGNLHTSFNHERLCEILKGIKHNFLLTYDDSDFIRNLYKDFYIREWNLQYGMNNFKQEKADVGKEILVSNKN